MKHKALIITFIIIIGGLFSYGIKSFVKEYSGAKSINITIESPNNVQNVNTKEVNNNILLKNKAAILQKIINNPVMEILKKIVEPKTENIDNNTKNNPINTEKNDIKNYLSKSSRINFPKYESISQAITFKKQGKPEALETIITLLEETTRELYAIEPPEEVKEIHKNSLWIADKFIEVLKKILKTTDDKGILNIINGPELLEIKEITNQTKIQLEKIIKQYNLEIEL